MSCPIYALLPLLGARDIRLLSIIPRESSDGQEQIRCKLEVASLNRRVKYHALSYTWGSPYGADQPPEKYTGQEEEVAILCNEQPFSIRPNLRDALLRIRESPDDWRERRIWVDAICIDQKTPTERSSQVRLMAEVYSYGETVMSWLGEANQCTTHAFQLIEKLATYPRETLQQITPRSYQTQRTLLGELAEHHCWLALAKLLQRTYFTRMWIIQEVVLARQIEVFCGSHRTQWIWIESVSHFLSTTAWTDYFNHIHTSDTASTSSASHPIEAMMKPSHALPTKLRAIRRDVKEGNFGRTLLHALIRSRVFQASDPRDKVYGVLGLLGDAAKNKPWLQPVYGTRDVSETYILATKQLLADADDLLVLSCVDGERKALAGRESLPSWVPDWTCDKSLGLGVTGYSRYSAAGELPKYARVLEPSLTLELVGHRIDAITVKGESKVSMLENGVDFSGWLSITSSISQTYCTGEDRMEVLWRTLVTNTGGDPPVHPIDGRYREGFVSWMISQLCQKHSHPQSPEFQSQFQSLVRLSVSSQTVAFLNQRLASVSGPGEPNDVMNDLIADEYASTYSHALHLSLFRTSEGYLGLGPESIEKEDSIWVVSGSRVPLIFRRATDDSHRLVGAAYLHGFMSRKTIDFADTRFQTIHVI
ncbi:uncharacterized protein E0L32_009308 [Thyridium curvatum]|uniref:Heterokaryon incompatibility domain-containing protein n=1 Tax=Thyridium curvatum TaxID=1093900 RepID=A0A507AYU9_9PEZI|nr:uncharacterized protein E0L32_009308 [Thyridium curvatum]TPX09420.1 hypothetical protein E0L32_009308 [Thyridium curvatum]